MNEEEADGGDFDVTFELSQGLSNGVIKFVNDHHQKEGGKMMVMGQKNKYTSPASASPPDSNSPSIVEDEENEEGNKCIILEER